MRGETFVYTSMNYKIRMHSTVNTIQNVEKSGIGAFIILPRRGDVSPTLKVISHKKRLVFIYASNMLERVLRLAKDLLCVHI